jgi:phenylacetate-CoA ligase
VNSSLDQQLDWLVRVDPGYLLCYPSVILGLGQLLRERGQRLPNLKQLRSFGEILEPNCRASCQELFGVNVVDMYSSQEVGYIALECRRHQHYHVQAENLLVEILDDAGNACRPGDVGRVVVTTLHNFAMPLLRYDIGDFAEVGTACPCGRNLPVLRRILGRQRNLLRIPNGQRRWPVFDRGSGVQDLPLFFQFQAVQSALEDIEVYFVRPGPLTSQEESRVKRYMQETLGYPFKIILRHVDEIPRNPTGKFEDFVSHIS